MMATIIATSLPKIQYIQFLQFCKKNKIGKSQCVRMAIIKYCNIEYDNTNREVNIEDELNRLLKDETK